MQVRQLLAIWYDMIVIWWYENLWWHENHIMTISWYDDHMIIKHAGQAAASNMCNFLPPHLPDSSAASKVKSYLLIFFIFWYSFSNFFANKCHIFDKYVMAIFVLQFLFSLSPLRNRMIRYGSKLSQQYALTFQNFLTL